MGRESAKAITFGAPVHRFVESDLTTAVATIETARHAARAQSSIDILRVSAQRRKDVESGMVSPEIAHFPDGPLDASEFESLNAVRVARDR